MIAVAAVVIASGALLIGTDEAAAHGSMESPPSRMFHCRFAESPETPTSDACRDAIAIGGTRAVYDWNEVNISKAGGNHQAVIPDGKLCSAGRDKYRGFDQARADWPAEVLTPGTPFAFKLRGTAPHEGTIELYVTRDGYDPTRPLRWDDLEASPFLTIQEEPVGGVYEATGTLPNKTGRHLIYAIWQRIDSPEAFYSCSDVEFLGGPGNAQPQPIQNPAPVGEPATHEHTTPTQDPTHEHATQADDPTLGETPTQAGTQAPAESRDTTAAPWQPSINYAVGSRVTFDGQVYEARQPHMSLPGWEPLAVPALWQPVSEPVGGQPAEWRPSVTFSAGSEVVFAGELFRCIRSHTALPGWEPPVTPALWQSIF